MFPFVSLHTSIKKTNFDYDQFKRRKSENPSKKTVQNNSKSLRRNLMMMINEGKTVS